MGQKHSGGVAAQPAYSALSPPVCVLDHSSCPSPAARIHADHLSAVFAYLSTQDFMLACRVNKPWLTAGARATAWPALRLHSLQQLNQDYQDPFQSRRVRLQQQIYNPRSKSFQVRPGGLLAIPRLDTQIWRHAADVHLEASCEEADDPASFMEIVLEQLVHLPQLKTLSLAMSDCDEAAVQECFLILAPRLQALVLHQYTDDADDEHEPMSAAVNCSLLTNLRWLVLKHDAVDPNALRLLHQLEHLSLEHCVVDAPVAAAIRWLSSRHLLRDVHISFEARNPVADLTQLESNDPEEPSSALSALSLDVPVTLTSAPVLLRLPNLTRLILGLHLNKPPFFFVRQEVASASLTELDVQFALDAASLTDLVAQMPALRSLHCVPNASDFDMLLQLKQLTSLEVSLDDLEDSRLFPALAQLPCFTSLTVHIWPTSDDPTLGLLLVMAFSSSWTRLTLKMTDELTNASLQPGELAAVPEYVSEETVERLLQLQLRMEDEAHVNAWRIQRDPAVERGLLWCKSFA